ILAGVAALHDQGVVHRDLKPGNVLLARRDRRVVPKLLDFGLAEGPFLPFPDAHLAARDFGTPHYMAPEQLRDPDAVGARLDIYALGAILYELATGVRAFPSDDPRVVMEAASRGHVTPVTKLAPDLPLRMTRTIEAALDPDPEARPTTCAELWQKWAAPDAPTLSRAARPSLKWRGVWLGELERLGPGETSGASWSPHEWSSTSTGWHVSLPGTRPPRRWSLALVLAALLGVAGLVGAGTLLAAWAAEAEVAPHPGTLD
ncbi:MAG: serine/threonine-protein kinase, partial [Myxococcota bacterium]